MDAPLITKPAEFEALLDRLMASERYAIDTEFSRESSYFPALGLLQIGLESEIFLVDPLEVDVRALRKVFESPAEAILHAGTQDFEIFQNLTGALPRRLFDTQIAGAFLGAGMAALGKLVQDKLGVHLEKGAQLSDWSRRPLEARALAYAASDVLHLTALRDALARELEERGRLTWAEEIFASQLEKRYGPPPPTQAWWKLKGRSRLRPRAAKIAQVLAEERELRARELDVPVRRVLADLPLVAMAESPPRTLEDLARVRGLEPQRTRGREGERLLAWIERGLDLPSDALVIPEQRPDEGPPQPLVSLCLIWAAQRAEEAGVEPSLLATRADVAGFLASPRTGRLTGGFRYELLGRDLEALAAGEAALGAEGDALRLIPIR